MLELLGGNWITVSELKKPTKPRIIYVDSLQYKSPGIFLYVEPCAIINHRNYLLREWQKYTHIITFDTSLLHLPNAIKYIYGTTWILPEDAESIKIKDKKFQISSLTGSKKSAIGHRFRLNIVNRTDFPLPYTFFRSFTPPITSKLSDKIHLFRDFQFSLVIENSRQENYFTEKLCDCLYTKTIPVYYGAPNINEYFDTTGWIILENESVDDLVQKLKQLDAEWYNRNLDTVEKNYKTVQSFLSFSHNVNKALDKIDDY
jgi:hypothetical protein